MDAGQIEGLTELKQLATHVAVQEGVDPSLMVVGTAGAHAMPRVPVSMADQVLDVMADQVLDVMADRVLDAMPGQEQLVAVQGVDPLLTERTSASMVVGTMRWVADAVGNEVLDGMPDQEQLVFTRHSGIKMNPSSVTHNDITSVNGALGVQPSSSSVGGTEDISKRAALCVHPKLTPKAQRIIHHLERSSPIAKQSLELRRSSKRNILPDINNCKYTMNDSVTSNGPRRNKVNECGSAYQEMSYAKKATGSQNKQTRVTREAAISSDNIVAVGPKLCTMETPTSPILRLTWYKKAVVSPSKDMESTLATRSSSYQHKETTKGDKEEIAESQSRQSIRPRGSWNNLPLDVLLSVGRKLVRSSRKDLVAMKIACKSWGDALETNGPWLTISSPSKIYMLKIISDDGVARLERVDCLFPPPPGSFLCWGAANGLLALHNEEENKTYLHCPVCGYQNLLTEVPANLGPKGVFFRDAPVVRVVMELGANNLMRLLYIQQFPDVENEEENEGEQDEEDVELLWAPYPDAHIYTRMQSVNFTPEMSFVAVTSDSMVVVDEVDREIGDDMIEIQIDAEDDVMMLWHTNGCHIFVCDHQIFICTLLKARDGGDVVTARVFHLQLLDNNAYHLQAIHNIGQYSVYLGSNQAVVLPSVDNFIGRQANTLYIEDNDGLQQGYRILSIDIETQQTESIPFPPDVINAMGDAIPAAWVSPTSPEIMVTHCQPQGQA